MEKSQLKHKLEQVKILVEECLFVLGNVPQAEQKTIKVSRQRKEIDVPKFDFTMTGRSFIKLYAKGMSGSKRFALLLAYLTKGNLGQVVKLEEIENHWKKMGAKSLMGKFARIYSTRAKENDWVESPKSKEYKLRPSWDKIFKNED